MKPHYLPSGDRMVLVEFAEEISLEINREVHRLASVLEANVIPGIVEWIPSYRSLGIIYDPIQISFQKLARFLDRMLDLRSRASEAPLRSVEIPVHYGEATGPDLAFVAHYNQLSPEEVVRIHTSSDYLVYFLGFTPGFPYLGGMSPRISAPRLEEPRLRVFSGSVGIGGNQTGIYPIESPGGWRIIGRTPLKLFDLGREDPFLLKPGDSVRFRAITLKELQSFA